MNIYTDIVEKFNYPYDLQTKDLKGYITEVFNKISNASDDEWNSLLDDTKNWYNSSVTLIQEKGMNVKLDLLPGIEDVASAEEINNYINPPKIEKIKPKINLPKAEIKKVEKPKKEKVEKPKKEKVVKEKVVKPKKVKEFRYSKNTNGSRLRQLVLEDLSINIERLQELAIREGIVMQNSTVYNVIKEIRSSAESMMDKGYFIDEHGVRWNVTK